MIYTAKTKEAMKLMFLKHKNQVDKSGVPYVFHPWHVAESMIDEDSTIVALLHDIVEDTDMTIENLIELGFSDKIIEAIKVLTHNKGDDYFSYIEKISKNRLATLVKVADLKHNMDSSRLEVKTEKYLAKLEIYKKSLAFLEVNLNMYYGKARKKEKVCK